MFELPEKVVTLATAIREAGGRALLVGGCVRDLLMGAAPKDWDLEVYGLESANFASLDGFGRSKLCRRALRVYKLDHERT